MSNQSRWNGLVKYRNNIIMATLADIRRWKESSWVWSFCYIKKETQWTKAHLVKAAHCGRMLFCEILRFIPGGFPQSLIASLFLRFIVTFAPLSPPGLWTSGTGSEWGTRRVQLRVQVRPISQNCALQLWLSDFLCFPSLPQKRGHNVKALCYNYCRKLFCSDFCSMT